MAVPYTFANATTSIPLSQLDNNFATAITIGNTAVYLGNTTTSFGNVTLNNANITSVAATFPNSFLANSTTTIGNTTVTLGSTSSSIGNLTLNNVTVASGNSTVTKETVTTITSPAATNLTIQSAGTTAMTIDTSQNVGIGTTSPNRLLSLYATQPVFQITNVASGNTQGTIQYQVSGSTEFVVDNQGSGSGGAIRWMQSGTERMRIDSSGNLLVGATATLGGSKFLVSQSGVNTVMTCQGGSTSALTQIGFYNPNGYVGSIQTSGSATSYVTSSDYRLKENVTPMTTGLAKISALKPVTYDWISDKSQGEGFIAHELQAVIPAAVTGAKDAVDADGNPQYQGVDYSKIVVHLVAAIQELSAEVTALKAKLGN